MPSAIAGDMRTLFESAEVVTRSRAQGADRLGGRLWAAPLASLSQTASNRTGALSYVEHLEHLGMVNFYQRKERDALITQGVRDAELPNWEPADLKGAEPEGGGAAEVEEIEEAARTWGFGEQRPLD